MSLFQDQQPELMARNGDQCEILRSNEIHRIRKSASAGREEYRPLSVQYRIMPSTRVYPRFDIHPLYVIWT